MVGLVFFLSVPVTVSGKHGTAAFSFGFHPAPDLESGLLFATDANQPPPLEGIANWDGFYPDWEEP